MFRLEQITSRSNQHIANARNIRDGRVRDAMFIEGRRLLGEALASGVVLTEVFVESDFSDRALLRDVSDKCRVFEVSENLLRLLADTENPQGIAAIAMRPRPVGLADLGSETSLAIFLQEAANPSNLGAIARTCEAAGADVLILSPGSADPFSPKALRASMGSAFRLPIVTATSLSETISWARANGIASVAAIAAGGRAHDQFDWDRRVLLVLGSEAHGLSTEQADLADEKATIPLAANVESLNLAVAAGVILFEARRQRG